LLLGGRTIRPVSRAVKYLSQVILLYAWLTRFPSSRDPFGGFLEKGMESMVKLSRTAAEGLPT
jgi:hypothetical protein